MAKVLWGKVYYKDTYAGRLEQDAGGRCHFTYDASYRDAHQPAIAHTLPLEEFNQLLGRASGDAKYEGGYEQRMGCWRL